MSSLCVINPKNTRHLQETRIKIKDLNISSNETIIFKQVVCSYENGLSKDLFSDLVQKSSSSNNGFKSQDVSTAEILKRLLIKENYLNAKIDTGFIVLDVPESVSSESAIGIDTFLNVEELNEYLKINGVARLDGDTFKSWTAKVDRNEENKNSRDYENFSSGVSNCVFLSQYFYIEMKLEHAELYLDELIRMNGMPISKKDWETKFIKFTRAPKKSFMYVINNESIDINVDPSYPEISTKNSKQRFLYVFEVIKNWLETFKDRWVEINANGERFNFLMKRRIGWAPIPNIPPTETSFKKDLNFFRDTIWFPFTIQNMDNEKKIKAVELFLNRYGINMSIENLFGTTQNISNISRLISELKPVVITETKDQVPEMPRPKSMKKIEPAEKISFIEELEREIPSKNINVFPGLPG